MGRVCVPPYVGKDSLRSETKHKHLRQEWRTWRASVGGDLSQKLTLTPDLHGTGSLLLPEVLVFFFLQSQNTQLSHLCHVVIRYLSKVCGILLWARGSQVQFPLELSRDCCSLSSLFEPEVLLEILGPQVTRLCSKFFRAPSLKGLNLPPPLPLPLPLYSTLAWGLWFITQCGLKSLCRSWFFCLCFIT